MSYSRRINQIKEKVIINLWNFINMYVNRKYRQAGTWGRRSRIADFYCLWGRRNRRILLFSPNK